MTAQTLKFPVKQYNREGVDPFKLALCCIMHLMQHDATHARISIKTWRKIGFLKETEADALLGFYGMDDKTELVR